MFLILLIVLLSKLFYNATVEISRQDTKINDLINEINEVQLTCEKAKSELTDVYNQQKILQSELEKRKIDLAKMKSRQEVVFKKPKLVERMINKSYSEFEKEVECTTSKQSHCQ